jgi:hypothetical protein
MGFLFSQRQSFCITALLAMAIFLVAPCGHGRDDLSDRHIERKRTATLMVEYEKPAFVTELQSRIPYEDLFIDEANYYFGLETKYHVTVASFLKNDVDLEELKTYLMDLSAYRAELTDISAFERPENDVLKCSVSSEAIHETHRIIMDNVPNDYPYESYQCHLTIAFLKPGRVARYVQSRIEPVTITPKNFLFSYYNEDGERIEIRF